MNLSSAQLDFYSCLNELDSAVGKALDDLDRHGYGQNTLTWLATDNGPEVNCVPEGRCTQQHYINAPGVADPLRGRKRDIWEGGHRIPSIISYVVLRFDYLLAGILRWLIFRLFAFCAYHSGGQLSSKEMPAVYHGRWW